MHSRQFSAAIATAQSVEAEEVYYLNSSCVEHQERSDYDYNNKRSNALSFGIYGRDINMRIRIDESFHLP